jgi:hypothetical protein
MSYKGYLQFSNTEWAMLPLVPFTAFVVLALFLRWPRPVSVVIFSVIAFGLIFPEWASTMKQPPIWRRATWRRAVAGAIVLAVAVRAVLK